ncbi:RNA methyltransferase [Paenibacillus sp. HN-1]|uniref:RNA methyltransferase n=1 Tax=Paenibacillus TaxID=44249 RepID=UPI001CA91612|nr:MULTISPECIES: RNA methyltransferase [Paenibacillus]MBY9081283.1 RNA methyltransferase [Paenibacillus sp. CGMCC 1.18879]MBY9087556.1 RNA methyltransferase [Paenibacillus sinensis]
MDDKPAAYLYMYRSHESESELCELEMNVLLQGERLGTGLVITPEKIDPGRSPFLTGRIDVLVVSDSLDDIAEYAAGIPFAEGETFKVFCPREVEGTYDEHRRLERIVGARMTGRADMKNPGRIYGIAIHEGRLWFGSYTESDRGWQARKNKPHNYSTGLGVALARSAVNIAAPRPLGIKVLDPCCGMGSVLIEGLSMGIDMAGCDLNPLAIRGAKGNLRHFGYSEEIVKLGDMRELDGFYDAAVLDMPYNLCSVLPKEDTAEMLAALRRLTARAVIISTESLEEEIARAGFAVIGGCIVSKGSFRRSLWLCT